MQVAHRSSPQRRVGFRRHRLLRFDRSRFLPDGFFLKLWKRIRGVDGRMVFCDVLPHEQEVLHLTQLDTLWPVCGTRADAVARLHRNDA